MRWGCSGVLKGGTFGVFWHLSPNFSNCTVQGVVGKSGERGSQNFYVNGSQDFTVPLLTP